jgi:glycosyltransferase involved in cell wall biosynthesis
MGKRNNEKSSLRVIVDGIVYGFQQYGGINTYFNEVLPRIGRLDVTLVDVLLPKTLKGQPPAPPVRILSRDLIPNRTRLSWRLDRLAGPLLKKINSKLIEIRVRARNNCIFHSTYFTWLGDSVPQVAMAYDMNHELFPDQYKNEWGQWLRSQYREHFRRATRIIAISEKTKKDVIRFYNIDPSFIDVVHLATNRRMFWPDRDREYLCSCIPPTGVREPYLLYVGIRGSYKNFDGLLASFAQSPGREKLKLVVAGLPWSQHELVRIRELDLESKVRLVVNPSDELLRVLYSCAAAFVYPSYHEGFGIPLLEAMACGTLVLAADNEVFHEVAGDAAIYFDPYDLAGVARALEASLDDRIRREYIGRGFVQVAKYSWDQCAEQTHAVYRKALGSRSY